MKAADRAATPYQAVLLASSFARFYSREVLDLNK